MDSIKIFTQALEFEKKIRDLYISAESMVDDERGKAIFRGLATDEQSHIDFLEAGLETLKNDGIIDPAGLTTTIPDVKSNRAQIEKMKTSIPERMLGDIKIVLGGALKMEQQTTDFYKEAAQKTEGHVRRVMEKFVEIEQRHTDVVRMELDHASNNGFWFDFMEVSMEKLD
ncbi:MAG: ferritin family protein [Desulfopila sp.]